MIICLSTSQIHIDIAHVINVCIFTSWRLFCLCPPDSRITDFKRLESTKGIIGRHLLCPIGHNPFGVGRQEQAHRKADKSASMNSTLEPEEVKSFKIGLVVLIQYWL